jgi:hypothetical protein
MIKIYPIRSQALPNYLLVAIVLGSLIGIMLQAPIKQDLAYHQFADARAIFGISNFYNVLSNLPFLFVGLAGAVVCYRKPLLNFRLAWLSFFIGVSLVCFGSAYYHLDPNNQSLVWDRLPMTIGFMGLFAALLGEFVNAAFVKYGLIPMILLGLISVLVWHWFDDLRLYVWVQFMPLLVIPMLFVLYRKKYSHSHYLLIALFFYVLAKLFEAFDMEIYTIFQNEMSGHAIKHVFAAIGSAVVLQMLRIRLPLLH